MDTGRKIKDAIARVYPGVTLENSLEEVIEKMAEHNTSALVVLEGGEAAGLVTVTDVLYSLANNEDLQETKVRSFMTKCDLISRKETSNPCAQLDEEQDVLSAIKVIQEAGVHHLVVSGAGGHPVGVVSSLELIKLIAG